MITIHTGSVIFSAMFSPADSTHIAVGGETGARGIDVRYPKGYRNKMNALYTHKFN